MIDLYLNYIQEKLEDITPNVKKKWYDIFDINFRKALRKEIEDIFNNSFDVKHSIINNKKTKIDVSLPLVGYVFWISINLYDKKGNDILDYSHPENNFGLPITIQIMREKSNKWTLYFHTLFLKHEYQKKGIGNKIIVSVNKCLKKLQNTREVLYQATGIGRYMISRIKNVKFKLKKGSFSEEDVNKGYIKWCKNNNIEYKKLNKPVDYPKDYLLSKFTPEFINYLVPI